MVAVSSVSAEPHTNSGGHFHANRKQAQFICICPYIDSVQGGLPFPIATPAHGTAFDIVGTGEANVEAMRQAFLLACRMGAHQSRARAAKPNPGEAIRR